MTTNKGLGVCLSDRVTAYHKVKRQENKMADVWIIVYSIENKHFFLQEKHLMASQVPTGINTFN
jgi:hypothetical protein